MSAFRTVAWLNLGLLAAACLEPGAASVESPARNVIFISLDTMRRDHVGFYGNPWIRTPNLDALAEESIVFDDFMVVVPTTLVSHTSLFTGKYPHNHGVPRNGYLVGVDNVMLTEILKKHGFSTAAFFGSFAISGRTNFHQGFDHTDEGFTLMAGEGDIDQNQRTAGEVTDAVIEYLEAREFPEHLFLFVHYFDPHQPYDPPGDFATMYPPIDPQTGETAENVYVAPEAMPPDMPDEHRQRAMRYAGEVSYTDRELGRLLDYLEAKGLLKESLLVLTTDHGERFWEHAGDDEMPSPAFHHGLHTTESTIQGAALVRMPGKLNAGTRIDNLVANIDILPTALKYLNLPIPEDVDGEAFDLTRPESFEGRRYRFAQATQPFGKIEKDVPWPNMRKEACLRSGRYKYVYVPYLEREALYDLSVDPLELNNLLARGDPSARQIADDLGETLREWIATADPETTQFVKEKAEDTRRRLEALGYLGE